jgi:fused signal recognition particle receptor
MVVLIIVIAAVVVIAGIAGFVALTRRDATHGELPPTDGSSTATLERPTTAPTEPAEAAEDTAPAEDTGPAVEETVPEEITLEEPELVEPDLTPPELVEPPVVVPEKPSFRSRLGKARTAFSGALGSIRSRSTIDQDTWDDLEEALLRADVGIGPTQELLDSVRATVKERGITTPDALIEAVKSEMKARLALDVTLERSAVPPTIWLFVGVNGVGKTTTIGKVGQRLADDGTSVVMAAGDTFRAAAAEQLGTWAERSGAELIRGAEGGDPSAIIFDAVAHAAANGSDVVLADTAGRLHTKSNLMEELAKVRRVADKGEGRVTEVLLVLDATTGQNGLVQARQFTEATELTGVVLTKLDGSAKGGIVFAIVSELGIPVKLVGLGETAVDLVDFDAEQFVEALFAE